MNMASNSYFCEIIEFHIGRGVFQMERKKLPKMIPNCKLWFLPLQLVIKRYKNCMAFCTLLTVVAKNIPNPLLSCQVSWPDFSMAVIKTSHGSLWISMDHPNMDLIRRRTASNQKPRGEKIDGVFIVTSWKCVEVRYIDIKRMNKPLVIVSSDIK